MKPKIFILVLLVLTNFLPIAPRAAGSSIVRTTFTLNDHYLTVELLDDDLAHFELSLTDPGDESIWTTPMVAKTDYPGPSTVKQPSPDVIETPEMRLEIADLCVTITDLKRQVELTTFCPLEDLEGLSFTQSGTTDLYGLGEHFHRRGNDNLIGERRQVLNLYGNELGSYFGGFVGNAQFPILYALGEGTENYALFLDNVYQQYWDFGADPFIVSVPTTPIRWYVMTGEDLPDLRRDYMELTGHSPVPPRQMFGLWVSEYGYDNWEELIGVLESLRAAEFPVDGFVLDLQWFGNITPKPQSQMGSLAWDEENFPAPAEFIRTLREEQGLGIMVIEEPYVSESAAGYDEAAAAGVLVRECEAPDCAPIHLDSWWGVGSMVDWTNPEAAAWWHDHRRQHLIDSGVMGHWTDLGEPEDFDDTAWYYGFPEFELHNHADIHNIYNFRWSQSIWEAYQQHNPEQRPFIMSRSGTSGSQRYGVAMWSGDIGANLPSLTAHLSVQGQMSLSGMDYFGSDIGGFYRQSGDTQANPDEVYTLWLANSALLDVPLRPHTMNVQNLFHTAPSLIGDVASNLANVRLRYELSPYLYTLAHLAYQNGDPIFAPMVYYFQADPNVRTLGTQKMIGADLMMATVTSLTDTVPVYLPAGGWFNYYTHEYIESAGQWIDVPTQVEGVLRAPLFVRAGAILPLMPVDADTFNILGQREDGSTARDLVLAIYSAGQGGDLTLIEDDGATMAYQAGDIRTTAITHGTSDNSWFVEIGAAAGTYADAPTSHPVEIHLITADQSYSQVTLNGEPVTPLETGEGVIRVRVDHVDVGMPLRFEFTGAQ